MAIGPPFAKANYTLSKGVENTLKAMHSQNVSRFICVTAIGSSESAKQLTTLARLSLRIGLRWLFKEKDKQEKLIRSSSLDYTIIRPTALTNGRKKGARQTRIGENLRSGILTQVSRADTAAAIIGLLEGRSSYKKALTVSYDAKFGDSIRWVKGYFGKG